MDSPNTVCPGCKRPFKPGGYANHLKFSHDPRCRSIRSSYLQTSLNPPISPSSNFPTPGPPPAPESPDVEMMDIDDDPGQLVGPSLIPPSFSQTIETSQPDTVGHQPHPSELPAGNSHHPSHLSHGVIVVDSDTDSDLSDDDYRDRVSHRRRTSSVGSGSSNQSAAGTFIRLCAMSLTLTKSARWPGPDGP